MILFFLVCAPNLPGASFFPAHFAAFLFSYLLSLFSFTEMKANAVYARAQAAILRSSGHSVKDIAKLLKKKPKDG